MRSKPTGDELDELRDKVEEHVTSPNSDEGQEIIDEAGSSSHVMEIWEDGEVTTTKGGDVYGARSLHQIAPPIWDEGEEVLWDTGDRDHKRMVVVDKEALKEVLEPYVPDAMKEDHRTMW